MLDFNEQAHVIEDVDNGFKCWFNNQSLKYSKGFVSEDIMRYIYNNFIKSNNTDSYSCVSRLAEVFKGEIFWILNTDEFIFFVPYHGYYCETGIYDLSFDEIYDAIPNSVVNKYYTCIVDESVPDNTRIYNYYKVLGNVLNYYTNNAETVSIENGMCYSSEECNKRKEFIKNCMDICNDVFNSGSTFKELLSKLKSYGLSDNTKVMNGETSLFD